jgi:hypothetical protein
VKKQKERETETEKEALMCISIFPCAIASFLEMGLYPHFEIHLKNGVLSHEFQFWFKLFAFGNKKTNPIDALLRSIAF